MFLKAFLCFAMSVSMFCYERFNVLQLAIRLYSPFDIAKVQHYRRGLSDFWSCRGDNLAKPPSMAPLIGGLRGGAVALSASLSCDKRLHSAVMPYITYRKILSKGKLKMLYFRNIGYESRPIGFCCFVSLQQLSN